MAVLGRVQAARRRAAILHRALPPLSGLGGRRKGDRQAVVPMRVFRRHAAAAHVGYCHPLGAIRRSQIKRELRAVSKKTDVRRCFACDRVALVAEGQPEHVVNRIHARLPWISIARGRSGEAAKQHHNRVESHNATEIVRHYDAAGAWHKSSRYRCRTCSCASFRKGANRKGLTERGLTAERIRRSTGRLEVRRNLTIFSRCGPSTLSERRAAGKSPAARRFAASNSASSQRFGARNFTRDLFPNATDCNRITESRYFRGSLCDLLRRSHP